MRDLSYAAGVDAMCRRDGEMEHAWYRDNESKRDVVRADRNNRAYRGYNLNHLNIEHDPQDRNFSGADMFILELHKRHGE